MRSRQLFLFATILLFITQTRALSLPDLIENFVSPPPSTAVVSGSFSVKDTAKNQGSVSAGASTTRYYLSLDKLKSSGDKLLSGQRAVPILAPGQSSSGTVSVSIPSGTAAGTYFLLACADDTKVVAEGNETNNCFASGTTIQIKGPDLKENSVSNPPTTAGIGKSFSVTDVAKNQGLTSAGASVTRYYLSTDKLKSSGDKLLSGSRSVPTLAAGQSSTGTVSVTVLSGTTAGIYYLLACADDTKVVPETNEINNCIASTSTVTVGPNFSLSVSPSTVNVPRQSTGTVSIKVNSLNGFTGTVTITPKNLPTGVTSAPINVVAGSSGTLTLAVSSATTTGPFTISLVGTSGTLSHAAFVKLTVPYGGGVLTIIPRTSGTNAFPPSAVAYVTKLITDIAPVRRTECGTATAAHTIEVVYNPNQGFSNYDENNLIINIHILPTPDATGVDQFFDLNLTHESAHALQTDILRIINGVNRRGTTADTEGIAQACADRVARSLALAGTRADLLDGGSLSVIWLDTFRRIDPEVIAAGGHSTSAAHAQPSLTLGEGSFLLAATQKGTHGVNGIVEHENALFAAESTATSPLTATDRIRIWDSTGLMSDGQSAGQWMPLEMIQDPVFSIGKPQIIAWPVYPQFPAQMMAQALIVTSNNPSTQPVVQPITSGPLTITVRDATPARNVVLGPLQADFSQTTGIANYSLSLQTKAPQGNYTVSVAATVNGTALQQSFVVANIPFAETGLGTPGLTFPGQYLIAVDSQGNANNGTLKVTRGSVVWSMTGFAIVQPDSTGTFDVTGPSGVSHTYTAPKPWARFISVE